MGGVVSRWRVKPSTVEVLEALEKDIHNLEEFRVKNQRVLKLWMGRLLLYSSVLYLITCMTVYFCYLPSHWTGRLFTALPFLAFPMLVWFLRKLLIFLFSKRTERNNEKLDDLKMQKRKILDEVMETETYKNAKLILERFDPESSKKEVESTPLGPQATPRTGQELRQRNVTPKPPVPGTPVGPAARPPLAPGATPTGPPQHTAPGGPPEKNPQLGLRRTLSPVPGTPVLGIGMHPPGPPLARPILPRERSSLDRVLEYLVGDGPQNRYALVCQQCFSHNGMALREEFEYVAFRCAYCFFLNPARKTRPHAPRLPEYSFEKRLRPAAAQPVIDPPALGSENPAATQSGGCAPALQTEAFSQSLGSTPWSKVHSFHSVQQQKDEGEQDAAVASSELPAQEVQDAPTETEPTSLESGKTPAEKSDEEEEEEVSQMEVE